MQNREQTIKIGMVGTGFIARGFSRFIARHPRYIITSVLTRRPANGTTNYGLSLEKDIITNSIDQFISQCDIVVEFTGDPVYATQVIHSVLEAGLPVVTMDAELHITTGSWLARKGIITEAEGDQPGSLAILKEDALRMGFKPLVLGNIKGFLNPDPTPEDMAFWSKSHGISIRQVTSFTDGTKVQIEQALVANGLDAVIAKDGLVGYECPTLESGALALAAIARDIGITISDYILPKDAPPGVFIVATHEEEQQSYLRYYKLGEGPHYILTRPFHLCHLEITKTLDRVLRDRSILLTNGLAPRFSIAAIAKRDIRRGEKIDFGIGSFDARGKAVAISVNPEHAPIGLLTNARVSTPLERGQTLTFREIEIPDSLALRAWQETLEAVI